MREIVINHQ